MLRSYLNLLFSVLINFACGFVSKKWKDKRTKKLWIKHGFYDYEKYMDAGIHIIEAFNWKGYTEYVSVLDVRYFCDYDGSPALVSKIKEKFKDEVSRPHIVILSKMSMKADAVDEWFDAGFSGREMFVYMTDWEASPRDCIDWKKEGFQAEEATMWGNAGCNAIEARRWIKYGFSFRVALPWLKKNIKTEYAIYCLFLYIDQDSALDWINEIWNIDKHPYEFIDLIENLFCEFEKSKHSKFGDFLESKEIVFRMNKLCEYNKLPHIWMKNRISIEDAKKWIFPENGRPHSCEVACLYEQNNISPEEVETWKETFGLYANEPDNADAKDYPLEEAQWIILWKKFEFSASEAHQWGENGFEDAEIISGWRANGFKPEIAYVWRHILNIKSPQKAKAFLDEEISSSMLEIWTQKFSIDESYALIKKGISFEDACGAQ